MHHSKIYNTISPIPSPLQPFQHPSVHSCIDSCIFSIAQLLFPVTNCDVCLHFIHSLPSFSLPLLLTRFPFAPYALLPGLASSRNDNHNVGNRQTVRPHVMATPTQPQSQQAQPQPQVQAQTHTPGKTPPLRTQHRGTLRTPDSAMSTATLRTGLTPMSDAHMSDMMNFQANSLAETLSPRLMSSFLHFGASDVADPWGTCSFSPLFSRDTMAPFLSPHTALARSPRVMPFDQPSPYTLRTHGSPMAGYASHGPESAIADTLLIGSGPTSKTSKRALMMDEAPTSQLASIPRVVSIPAPASNQPPSEEEQRPRKAPKDKSAKKDKRTSSAPKRGEYKCGKCGFFPKKAKHDCTLERARRSNGGEPHAMAALNQHHHHQQQQQIISQIQPASLANKGTTSMPMLNPPPVGKAPISLHNAPQSASSAGTATTTTTIELGPSTSLATW
eukprot:m.89198 g.89198  ORF g.89198 m.89198 type:complete len:445 (+) comp12884_c0_seq5:262-1596(+)